jgi:hypothetical protein
MSSPLPLEADERGAAPEVRTPTVYMLPITDDRGVRRTLILDEQGLAEYRRLHPPRPLDEIIGGWGVSDEEWEAFLRWEDELKRESRPTPLLDEEFPDLFDER